MSISQFPRIMLTVIALIFLVAVMPASAADTIVSNPSETTEFWQGKVLTATFRAGMCHAPDGKARGVLYLRHANGQEDTYHLYGTIKNNEFRLSHSSGHVFSGKFSGGNNLEGKAKLKNGISLSLKGTRTLNVPLVAKDCAPLPQSR